MLDLRILGLEFENIIVTFEVSVLKLILLQSLVQRKNFVNLGPKCLIWVFWGRKLKIILSY